MERKYERRLQKATHWSRAGFGMVLKGYEAPAVCESIADAMLHGIVKHSDICDELGINTEEYVKVMSKPENMAWVSNVMIQNIEYLYGLLDWKMYQLAMGGSVSAYKALMDRFGKAAARKSFVAHANVSSSDFKDMTREQIEKEAKNQARALGLIVDVRQTPEGRTAEAAPGNGEPTTRSSPSVLQTPPASDGVPRGGEEVPPESSAGG